MKEENIIPSSYERDFIQHMRGLFRCMCEFINSLGNRNEIDIQHCKLQEAVWEVKKIINKLKINYEIDLSREIKEIENLVKECEDAQLNRLKSFEKDFSLLDEKFQDRLKQAFRNMMYEFLVEVWNYPHLNKRSK